MPPHSLTNLKIRKYYQNEARFNGVYPRDNLCNKIKNGAYVINLDEYEDVGTQWIALICKNNENVYFDSLELNIFLKKLKLLLDIKTSKQTYLEYNQAIK